MPKKTQAYGIDTSIFVRLLTGDPAGEYEKTLAALTSLAEASPETFFHVSNMVIGEAYIVLQHHYGVSKSDARAAIASVLRSGLVMPLAGERVFEILAASEGCGLIDRLIAADYGERGCTVLTNDRKMAAVDGARRLY
jgi:predicted nucleic acid-binding protein